MDQAASASSISASKTFDYDRARMREHLRMLAEAYGEKASLLTEARSILSSDVDSGNNRMHDDLMTLANLALKFAKVGCRAVAQEIGVQ